MKKLSVSILIFLFLCAADATAAQNSLPEHEKLTYNVSWLGIGVGTLVISINGTKNINGRSVYVLEAIAKSHGILSGLKKIDSMFISYFDAEKLYPVRQEIYRNDGNCKDRIIIDFDQVNHKAHQTDLNKNMREGYAIANNVQDILSNYYYYMLIPFKVGDMVRCPVLKNRYSYRFSGFVESKDIIRVPAFGNEEKDALLIYPYAEKRRGEIYKGHTSVYYSFDKRRIPLLMKSRALKFGQLIVSLVKQEK